LCRDIPVKPLMHGARDDRMLLSNEVAACVGRGSSGTQKPMWERAWSRRGQHIQHGC
jgi:hypothetical protein